MNKLLASSFVLVAMVAGCAAPTGPASPAPAAAPAAPAAPVAAPAPLQPAPPAPFTDAVTRAGERLLQDAQKTVGAGPRELVIDPLIDASTGQQTAGTVQMASSSAC